MSADGGKSKKDKHHNQLSASERADEYLRLGIDSWEETWRLLHDSHWKVEAGTDLTEGVVYSQHIHKRGKIFMLQGYVDASPEFTFKNSVLTIEESPKWNPMVTDIRTLQVINDCTDINYNITSEVAGGLISSRDFVSVRHWGNRDGIIISAGCAVVHPDMPPSKKHVRGENRSGGWIFKPVPDNPDRCIFAWIADTDIKGWVPHYVVEQAFSGSLLQFIRHLRLHIQNVKANTEAKN